MAFSISRLTMFAIISAIEEDLRATILDHLSNVGPAPDILGKPLCERLVERCRKDLGYLESTTLEQILPYADIGDTYSILNSNRGHLPSALAGHLKKRTDDLARLVPIRNRIMHTRPFSAEDFALILDTARELSSFEAQWTELRATMARLKTEPSFVLRLELPTRDWEFRNDNHNLPLPDFDDTGFVGRTKEVAEIVRLCTSQWPVITVVGEGGLGKTALVLKAAYEVLDDPARPFDAVVWTTAKTKQLTAQSIVDIKGAITTSVGILRSIAEQLSGGPPDDHLVELLDYLAAFRVLVIIDNLETVLDDRIRSFLRDLPAGSKVLITSRIGLGEFEHRVKLGPMKADDSLRLLRSLATVRHLSGITNTANTQLATYCRQMHDNPGYIKWFISVVQAGQRPEAALAKPEVFLEFCLSNVYEYLSRNSKVILEALLVVSGARTQAEIAFLSGIAVPDLQEAIHQLLSTNMLIMSSVPKGSSLESRYDLTELAREYLAKYRPTSRERSREIIKRYQQMTSATELLRASQIYDPYSIYSMKIDSANDRIVAKYLVDALNAVRRLAFAKAEESIKTARDLDPSYFEVFRVEAWLRAEQGNYAAARLAYEAAVELEPNSAPLRLFYGGFLMRYLNATEEAVGQLQAAHKLAPESVEIRLELNRAYLFLSEFDKAEEEIHALLNQPAASEILQRKIHDLHLQYHYRKADFLVARRDYNAATSSLLDMMAAYEAIPSGIRDSEMTRRLRKAFGTVIRCSKEIEDGEFGSKVSRVLSWLEAMFPRGGTTVRSPRCRGTVRRFWTQKGYGFVKGADGEELFFHKNSFAKGRDWLQLRNGDVVEYAIGRDAKGKCAVDLERFSSK